MSVTLLDAASSEQPLLRRRRSGFYATTRAAMRRRRCASASICRRRRARRAVPVLYWLSGLTCTEENFIVKAGAQRVAAELGLAIVAPDTSPRGAGVPGEGDGAGTSAWAPASTSTRPQAPWSRRYRMYTYVTRGAAGAGRSVTFRSTRRGSGDLRPLDGRARRARPRAAQSRALPLRVGVRARSPRRCACPWGEKALTRLSRAGSRRVARIRRDRADRGPRMERPPLLVDQGTADQFLESQLKPELLREACRRSGVRLDFACTTATTTATSSSRPSSRTTFDFTPAICKPARSLHARSAPEALAVCVAMASISGGDRQS